MLTHSAPFSHIPLLPRTDTSRPRQKSSVYIQPHVHLYIYTTRQRADRAARGVLRAAFNHDKSSFCIRLLEEVTDLGKSQEERVPACCPEDNSILEGTVQALPNHDQTRLHQADSQATTLPAAICHRNSFAPHSSALWRALKSG